MLAAKKLTKEEKKAETERKKAERDERKAAEKAMKDAIAANREGGEEGAATVDITDGGGGAEASGSADKPKKAATTSKKGGKKGANEELKDGLLTVDEGTLKFAVCTGNLSSRKDSKDVKIQAFSISLFGKVGDWRGGVAHGGGTGGREGGSDGGLAMVATWLLQALILSLTAGGLRMWCGSRLVAGAL